MDKHPDDDFMDSYLLGKIGESAREEFEEHYFNCPDCFKKVTERDQIMNLLKDDQVLGVLAEYTVDKRPRRPWWRRILWPFRRRHS